MRLITAILLSAGVPAPALASPTSDLRDYAIAACLIRQDISQPLKTEGYRLSDIVIHRAGIDPFAWKPLAAAVDAALARQGMLMVHVDAPVAEATQPAPLASCLLAIEDPAVRSIMAQLRVKKKR